MGQPAADNMDGKRQDVKSTNASPVFDFVAEQKQFKEASKRRRFLGDILLILLLLQRCLPDYDAAPLLLHFPHLYVYIGADCSPAGSTYLGLSLEEARTLVAPRLFEALGVQQSEVDTNQHAISQGDLCLASLAADLDCLLLQSESPPPAILPDDMIGRTFCKKVP